MVAELTRKEPTREQLVEGYRPSDDEPFMSERQREYFRRKLQAWREEILREAGLAADEITALLASGATRAAR